MIGAESGGVWETRDAGANWIPKTDNQAWLGIGAIAFAPSNSSIIYVGTASVGFDGDSYAFDGTFNGGVGILKSTDGGTTWQLLGNSTFLGKNFSVIKVHPTDTNTVLAATSHGIFKSTDGGVTWIMKLGGPNPSQATLEVDPSNFSDQYALIVQNSIGSPANGLYRSTNAGETWTQISGPWSVLAFSYVAEAIAPSNPNVLYVHVVDSGGPHIWRTDNAWASTPSWTSLPNPSPNAALIINVDPANATILYAGEVQLYRFNGTNWVDITGTIHIDQHSIAWAGNRVIVGNDGGIFSSLDSGNTWASHNTNLSITQFYFGSIHPSNTKLGLGGSQDNGVEKWTGSNAWSFLFVGDGGDNAISSTRPDTDWAFSIQTGSIVHINRTLDGGVSNEYAGGGIDPYGSPSLPRFRKCSSNDNVFILGTDNLWKTTSFFAPGSPIWSSNSPEVGFQINAIAFAPSDATCNTYAFGGGQGQLRLTTNGGNTWVDINTSNTVPRRRPTGLAFDPTNSNILYVILGGYDQDSPGQPGHVFKTTNALVASPTWTNVSPPVNIPHKSIVLDPANPNTVYVGTALGIWKSTDGGTSWTHMGPETGMPNVPVTDLKMNSTGRLVAFTYGRGAFVLQSRLIGISTRARVLTGDNVEIGGFIIGGSTPKTVLIRARGPSMAGAPFNLQGTLANPTVQLYSGSTVIAQNDNWQTTDPLCGSPAISCGNATQIAAMGLDPCQPNPGQTSAPPGCSQESAILITLPPGGYTAIVSGVGGGTGIGLVEAFDLGSTTASKLIGISTRARVETGNNVEIGGFIIGGSTPKTVLIRARGPSMSGAPFFVPGTLANPKFQLYSGQTVIAQNDDWQVQDPLCVGPATACSGPPPGLDPCQPNPGQTTAPPNCNLESAMAVTLPPGPYTAIVSGVGGGTGIGLVEVFDLE